MEAAGKILAALIIAYFAAGLYVLTHRIGERWK
mgnify:CR=1 FL=1